MHLPRVLTLAAVAATGLAAAPPPPTPLREAKAEWWRGVAAALSAVKLPATP